MTDRYDEMRVAPDPSQAEALRQRLHARLATAARDDPKDQSQLHRGARLDRQPHRDPMKEIYVSVESPTHEGRNRRRLAMAAAAVVAVIGVTGIAVAVATSSGDDATQSPAAATTLAPTTSVAPVTEELPEQAPVEVSACVNPGPAVHVGTEERSQVSLPEGEMTITRDRGDTWRLNVSDVSDPRLDGTWYNSADGDLYSLPGGASGPHLATETHRIENDDGAWQGSFVVVGTPDHPSTGLQYDLQYVLVGEGAYEGLTAVMIGSDGACPNTRGYIVEGNVPAPPVPQTGQ